MKELAEYKETLHSCSKCGLCQAECPIYKITGNDCTVSRGQFIMLQGLLKGELKMTKNLNKYLDLCLKCGKCSKFCPSDIDVVDVIASAKAEYFKTSKIEKLVSIFQKKFIFGIGISFLNFFSKKIQSKKFEKKVIYFGGCGSKIKGNEAVVKILNSIGIEVITPDFECCGIPFYVRGDKKTFEEYRDNFLSKISEYETFDIITTCASCEKTIKSYLPKNYNIKNIYEYLKSNNLQLELKNKIKVTYHKPCNIDNFPDILWILNNTKNLEYVEMDGYDECCGLNGITKISEYSIFSKIFKKKFENIKKTKAKYVLTSCLGCEAALLSYSFGRYRVADLVDFLHKNIKK